MRSRAVCFTSWETDYQLLPEFWPRCTFAVWQMELAPDTLAPHYQGYMELDTQVAFSTLHLFEGLETAHFESRRGTQAQAIAYCQKEDSRMDGPYTWGTPKHQGFRTDVAEVTKLAKAGKSLKRVADEFPEFVIKYPTGTKLLLNLHAKPRDFLTVCFVLYGAGGTGKTTFADKLAHRLCEGDQKVYDVPMPKGGGMIYWDTYDQGDVCVINEFKGNYMLPTYFNSLIDKIGFEVATHGGSKHFASKYVIITTNVNPLHWWPELKYKKSLRRRIILWPIFRNLGYVALPKQPRVQFPGYIVAPRDDNNFYKSNKVTFKL